MTAVLPSPAVNHANCIGCGRRHDVWPGVYHCTCERQENLAIGYDLGPTTRAALLQSVAENENSLWRYAPLLPIDRRYRSPLNVGWTPLYDFGEYARTRFFLKDETRNPSGTLKDRASEVVIAAAAAHDIADVIVASTGNAAASLACIGAAAHIHVTILVPRTVPDAKLAQIVAYGAAVYKVDGTYDDAYALAQKVSAAKGIFNRSTGLNPFTREGKKTCAFEIAEQLKWQAPDWVIVPAGDGNILSALWKGFEELAALGLLPSLPRMVAAQAAAFRAFGVPHHRAQPAFDSLDAELDLVMTAAEIAGDETLKFPLVNEPVAETDREGRDGIGDIGLHDAGDERGIEPAAEIGAHRHVGLKAAPDGLDQRLLDFLPVGGLRPPIKCLIGGRKGQIPIGGGSHPAPVHGHEMAGGQAGNAGEHRARADHAGQGQHLVEPGEIDAAFDVRMRQDRLDLRAENEIRTDQRVK